MKSLSARAADTPMPKRLVLMYTPNGTYLPEWFPQDPNGETDFTLGRILTPLAPFRDRMILFKGVNSTVAQAPENNGGPHQRGIGSLFTGRMLQTGTFRDGCGSQAGWADGISIDQVVAGAIGLDTPFRSLELGVRAADNDVQGRISYAGPGQPLPPTNDPAQVFERLFGLASREPIDPENPDDARRSVLDAVQEQFSLVRPKLGAVDREKFDAHLELVGDLERRLGIVNPDGSSCMLPTSPPPLDPTLDTDMPGVSRAQWDLLAAAFACDLTRVASVQYSTGFNRIPYPWLGSTDLGHSLSHQGESNTAKMEELTLRAQWHAQELAYFLGLLAEIPEGDGTVLESTMILWGNEISHGQSHSLDDIPYLMLGNAGSSIKTGRYLEYAGASSCDLLAAVQNAFGVEDQTFGHPDFCTGPLSGLTT